MPNESAFLRYESAERWRQLLDFNPDAIREVQIT